jgi:hypothetical protein
MLIIIVDYRILFSFLHLKNSLGRKASAVRTNVTTGPSTFGCQLFRRVGIYIV